MKDDTWTSLFNLLGKDSEIIMLGLVLDCAVFLSVEQGKDNYYQVSGQEPSML